MTTRRHPLVCVITHSTVVTDDAVTQAIVALQHQVTYHFQPHWNAGCTLLQVKSIEVDKSVESDQIVTVRRLNIHEQAAQIVQEAIPAGAWLLVIADDSDQAGALGYHDVDPKTTPIGYVFAKTDADYHLSWTVTASHELLEMLGDPLANQCVQIKADGTALAYETADAVEADEDGYLINLHPLRALGAGEGQGVLVSNFVFPSWFVAGSPGPWDYLGKLKGPLELRPGGYIGVWRPGKGWTQVTARAQVIDEQGAGMRAGRPRHVEGPRFRMRHDGHALPALDQLPEWLA